MGTAARCFLPYRKNPNPIELKSNPQSSVDVFMVAVRGHRRG